MFVGGIAPDTWPPGEEEITSIADHFSLDRDYVAANIGAVHRKSGQEREQVLPLVQRIADIISHILEDRNDLYGRLRAIASLASF